jgi:hypothetical protein
MTSLRFPVDVLMRRVVLANRWASERWQPQAVVPAGGPGEAVAAGETLPRRVADGADGTTWRFAGFGIELHRSEGEGYFLNLASPSPSVFVMWRGTDEGAEPPLRPYVVTVSYNEAARMLDAGEQVEPVPMAPAIHAWVEPFMRANYTPEPRKKVRRNDPFAADATRGGRGQR